MPSASKTEKIFIQDGDQVIELTGVEKELFETNRKQMQDEAHKIKAEADAQKKLKISAYTKLGLTEEEINAIL